MVKFEDPNDPPNQGQQFMTTNSTTSSRHVSGRNKTPAISLAAVDSLTSVIANGDKEREFLLKKRKQNFNYLTLKILKEQQQQKLAALHYTALHDYCLFVPSILITLTSAILAILVKSTLVPSENVQTWIALLIAILSILSTFVQSLMKQLNFSGRAGFHLSASTALSKLYSYVVLSSREAKYNSIYRALKSGTNRVSIGSNLTQVIAQAQEEDEDGSEGGKSADGNAEHHTPSHPVHHAKTGKGATEDQKDDQEHSQDSITSQFRQAVDTCNSDIPINISAAFNMIEARLALVNKSMMKNKPTSKIDFSVVFPSVYYQLSQTILQSRGFPTRLPKPEWSVDKALKDWKAHLRSGDDNSADLIGDLIERHGVITNLGNTHNFGNFGEKQSLLSPPRPSELPIDVI